MHLRIVFLGLCVLLTRSSIAHADAKSDARRLYEEGSTEYNLNEFDKALDAFKGAYRLVHDASLLFNIAQCERQLGHYETAARTFRTFLRESPKLPPKVEAETQHLIAEMDQAVKEHRAAPIPPKPAPPVSSEPEPERSPPPAHPPEPPPPERSPPPVLAPPSPPSAEHTPVYKKWWLWTAVGAAAVGLGVGLGVGLAPAHVVYPTPGQMPAGGTVTF